MTDLLSSCNPVMATPKTHPQFLIESGRERDERLLADRTSFSVDSDAWEEIVAAMDQPVKVRPELAKLFSRPRPVWP